MEDKPPYINLIHFVSYYTTLKDVIHSISCYQIILKFI